MNLGVDFSGLADLAFFLGNLQVVYQLSGNKIQSEVGDSLMQKIKANASATCHSLKDFRYKDANGKWRYMYSVRDPMNPHPEKPYLVHKHTGQLVSSLGMKRGKSKKGWYIAYGFYPSVCPYTGHVIYGTERMIRRNFIKETIEKEGETVIKPKVMREMDWLHRIVVNLYTLARVTKWMSKVYGDTALSGMLYRSARRARNIEVMASGSFPIYGTRFYNTMVAGKIASKFMIRGKGIPPGVNRLANARINAAISRNIASKYVFLRAPRRRRRW
ncbi:hypothetical protein J7M02_00960 [Candidatus Aerophobetes bacterium]|nr:hypothetical protein [Candidatus Aerophobetes bacterium]